MSTARFAESCRSYRFPYSDRRAASWPERLWLPRRSPSADPVASTSSGIWKADAESRRPFRVLGPVVPTSCAEGFHRRLSVHRSRATHIHAVTVVTSAHFRPKLSALSDSRVARVIEELRAISIGRNPCIPFGRASCLDDFERYLAAHTLVPFPTTACSPSGWPAPGRASGRTSSRTTTRRRPTPI
jgi:hypothetical protein